MFLSLLVISWLEPQDQKYYNYSQAAKKKVIFWPKQWFISAAGISFICFSECLIVLGISFG